MTLPACLMYTGRGRLPRMYSSLKAGLWCRAGVFLTILLFFASIINLYYKFLFSFFSYFLIQNRTNMKMESAIQKAPVCQPSTNLKTHNLRYSPNKRSNIMELTEENSNYGRSTIINRLGDKMKMPNQPVESPDIFSRGLKCLRHIYNLVSFNQKEKQIMIEESQISEIISRLKRNKKQTNFLLPASKSQKKTLVLDLDETLICTHFKKPSKYDFEIEVELKGEIVTGYVIKRFGLDAFLFQMSELYEIVIFSSSRRKYVDQVIAKVDPKNRISFVLAREECTIINKSYFLKPVRDLGRDPKSVIVVDDNRMSAALNLENLYKIEPFKGCSKDRKLIKLGYFLKHAHSAANIVPIELLKKQFESKEIKIYDTSKKKSIEAKSLIQSEDQSSSVTLAIRQ